MTRIRARASPAHALALLAPRSSPSAARDTPPPLPANSALTAARDPTSRIEPSQVQRGLGAYG
jgi:hypothetical protein